MSVVSVLSANETMELIKKFERGFESSIEQANERIKRKEKIRKMINERIHSSN